MIAYVIAGTNDSLEFDKDDIIPVIGTLLAMLCEAFSDH